MKKPKLFFIMTVFGVIQTSMAETPQWPDSVSLQIFRGGAQYDKGMLLGAVENLKNRTSSEQNRKHHYLLLGWAYWRLELIAFCTDKSDELIRYGKEALEQLDKAETEGADTYIATGYRALVCLILAGQGFSLATTYGPKAGNEMKKLKNANPQGYLFLLSNAINLNQAPSFVGGNPKKAVIEFEAMEKLFPDSIDVKIHLAEAYTKNGRREEASALIEPILKRYPYNLLARKIYQKLQKK